MTEQSIWIAGSRPREIAGRYFIEMVCTDGISAYADVAERAGGPFATRSQVEHAILAYPDIYGPLLEKTE